MCHHFFECDVIVRGFGGMYDECNEESFWVIVLGGGVSIMV